jgi:amidophosphoribosyltransferase
VEEIRAFLGVDSLHYLSLDGLLACVDREPRSYCTACFSGDYRLDPDHPQTEIVVDSQQATMF